MKRITRFENGVALYLYSGQYFQQGLIGKYWGKTKQAADTIRKLRKAGYTVRRTSEQLQSLCLFVKKTHRIKACVIPLSASLTDNA